MDTIFMNTRSSETSDFRKPLLNYLDKINIKNVIQTLLYQILAFTIHEKIQKSHIK